MCELKDDGLRIVTPGPVIHEHHAIGTRIVQVLPIGAHVMVLEDYYGFPRGQSNLYCLDQSLRPIWFAEGASRTDTYVGGLAESDGGLQCASWEGWLLSINVSTGRIMRRVFTK